MSKIENLVFKGGGVLGISYAGAIRVLEEAGLMNDIRRVAGTSVGALVACLVSLNYSAAEIEDVMRKTEFNKFLGSANPLNIPRHYGLYSGDYLLKWIEELIENKTADKSITFKELNPKEFRELYVVATDLSSADIKVFSAQKTPDTIVAESIRASMSIPMVFKAWKFSNGKPDDHIYVDGGVVSNYPIGVFEEQKKTLGLYIDTHIGDEVLGFDDISKYARYLFKAVLRGQDIDHFRKNGKNDLTVHIDNMGYSSIDFDLSESDQEKLYQSGLLSTQKFLRNRKKNTSIFQRIFGSD